MAYTSIQASPNWPKATSLPTAMIILARLPAWNYPNRPDFDQVQLKYSVPVAWAWAPLLTFPSRRDVLICIDLLPHILDPHPHHNTSAVITISPDTLDSSL